MTKLHYQQYPYKLTAVRYGFRYTLGRYSTRQKAEAAMARFATGENAYYIDLKIEEI